MPILLIQKKSVFFNRRKMLAKSFELINYTYKILSIYLGLLGNFIFDELILKNRWPRKRPGGCIFDD